MSVWYEGRYIKANLRNLRQHLPAVRWGTQDWARLAVHVELAVGNSLEKVESGDVHLPLLKAAFGKAFAEVSPLQVVLAMYTVRLAQDRHLPSLLLPSVLQCWLLCRPTDVIGMLFLPGYAQ